MPFSLNVAVVGLAGCRLGLVHHCAVVVLWVVCVSCAVVLCLWLSCVVFPVVWINAIVGAWFALLGAVSLGAADVPLKGL